MKTCRLGSIGLLMALVLIGTSLPASRATTIERTVFTDLRALDLPASAIPSQGPPAYLTMPLHPTAVNEGDTFVLHHRFTGGSLRVTDTGRPSVEYMGWSLHPHVTGSFLSNFIWDVTFRLEGVAGSLLVNDFKIGPFGGPLGGFFSGVNLTDTTFLFTGVTLTFSNIVNFNPGKPSFIVEEVNFVAFFSPEDGLFVRVGRVAEPSIFSLLGIALAGMWLARRKWEAKS
jgi:hypothetical protein